MGNYVGNVPQPREDSYASSYVRKQLALVRFVSLLFSISFVS
jgi:hypothetical protein